MHEAERGLFDLQQGRPLYVTDRAAPVGRSRDVDVVLAIVESASGRTLDTLRQIDEGPLRLAVTQHRARVMGLANGGTSQDMSFELNGGVTRQDEILRLCTATGVVAQDPVDLRPASMAEVGGLALARLGRLLPAVVGVPVRGAPAPPLGDLLASGAILGVTTAQIDAMARNARVEVTQVSDGPVPLEDAEDARFMVFREANGILEHVAVLIGDPAHWPDPVPVRLHSACLTGDLFGSLRCDCGQQLRGILRVFAARRGGVLLYLAQEGRGIGLGNKLRAYALQQEGLDTVDADFTLGFGADERCYDAAVEMLRLLRIERVQLLTNNPDKVRALQDGGINVMDRQPLYGTLNRHNLPYVKAKVDRAGHWLADMLSGAGPCK